MACLCFRPSPTQEDGHGADKHGRGGRGPAKTATQGKGPPGPGTAGNKGKAQNGTGTAQVDRESPVSVLSGPGDDVSSDQRKPHANGGGGHADVSKGGKALGGQHGDDSAHPRLPRQPDFGMPAGNDQKAGEKHQSASGEGLESRGPKGPQVGQPVKELEESDLIGGREKLRQLQQQQERFERLKQQQLEKQRQQHAQHLAAHVHAHQQHGGAQHLQHHHLQQLQRGHVGGASATGYASSLPGRARILAWLDEADLAYATIDEASDIPLPVATAKLHQAHSQFWSSMRGGQYDDLAGRAVTRDALVKRGTVAGALLPDSRASQKRAGSTSGALGASQAGSSTAGESSRTRGSLLPMEGGPKGSSGNGAVKGSDSAGLEEARSSGAMQPGASSGAEVSREAGDATVGAEGKASVEENAELDATGSGVLSTAALSKVAADRAPDQPDAQQLIGADDAGVEGAGAGRGAEGADSLAARPPREPSHVMQGLLRKTAELLRQKSLETEKLSRLGQGEDAGPTPHQAMEATRPDSPGGLQADGPTPNISALLLAPEPKLRVRKSVIHLSGPLPAAHQGQDSSEKLPEGAEGSGKLLPLRHRALKAAADVLDPATAASSPLNFVEVPNADADDSPVLMPEASPAHSWNATSPLHDGSENELAGELEDNLPDRDMTDASPPSSEHSHESS